MPDIPRVIARIAIVAIAVGAVGFTGTPANAQTRFQHPDTTPDYARYGSPFYCLAAASRERIEYAHSLPFWKDTMEVNRIDGADTLSATVIQAMRRCLEKFDPNVQPVELMDLWMRLYLIANRDDAAETMLRRRLEQETPEGRVQALEKALDLYTNAQPIRVTQIDAIIPQIEAQTTKPLALMGLYGMRMNIAVRFDDSVTALRLSQKIVELARTLTPAEKATPNYMRGVRYSVLDALDRLSMPALRDSLRKSAAAYIALSRFNWMTALPDSINDERRFVGKPSASIVADTWFTSGDSTPASTTASVNGPNATPRHQAPTPGVTSLLLFMSAACRDEVTLTSRVNDMGISARCWGTYATTRRLKERFPNLDITIVTTAVGHVGEMGPLTPQQEAQVLKSWWLGYHRLPVKIAMTFPESFRLEEPDQRVIDRPNANDLHYGFGRTTVVGGPVGFLVAPTGEILWGGPLSPDREQNFAEILEILMPRQN